MQFMHRQEMRNESENYLFTFVYILSFNKKEIEKEEMKKSLQEGIFWLSIITRIVCQGIKSRLS